MSIFYLYLQLLISMMGSCGAWMSVQEYPRNSVSSIHFNSIPARTSSFETYMAVLSDAEYGISQVPSSPLLVAAIALALGVGAQSFINQMLRGDQGLGAFLKDGSGYNRSAFRSSMERKGDVSDPLPWLKLPKLDFVDVAGQENLDLAYKKLEEMRTSMNRQLELGNVREASRIKEDLERLMQEAGIEYTSTDEER
eukprot:scaffold672_cov126-Cylindrotheca_fusiformis.AAC.25